MAKKERLAAIRTNVAEIKGNLLAEIRDGAQDDPKDVKILDLFESLIEVKIVEAQIEAEDEDE